MILTTVQSIMVVLVGVGLLDQMAPYTAYRDCAEQGLQVPRRESLELAFSFGAHKDPNSIAILTQLFADHGSTVIDRWANGWIASSWVAPAWQDNYSFGMWRWADLVAAWLNDPLLTDRQHRVLVLIVRTLPIQLAVPILRDIMSDDSRPLEERLMCGLSLYESGVIDCIDDDVRRLIGAACDSGTSTLEITAYLPCVCLLPALFDEAANRNRYGGDSSIRRAKQIAYVQTLHSTREWRDWLSVNGHKTRTELADQLIAQLLSELELGNPIDALIPDVPAMDRTFLLRSAPLAGISREIDHRLISAMRMSYHSDVEESYCDIVRRILRSNDAIESPFEEHLNRMGCNGILRWSAVVDEIRNWPRGQLQGDHR